MDQFNNFNNQKWLADGHFRVKSMLLSPGVIVPKIIDKSIDIKPSFKNHSKWPISWESKVVESLLIGFPLQKIFCEESKFGDLIILDGSHIIDSIYSFVTEDYALKDLSLRKDLNGLKIKDLSYRDYNTLMDRSLIDFSIISYDTPTILKYEFFKRINSTNTRFTMQSARNYAFPKMYELITTAKDESSFFMYFAINNRTTTRDILKSDSDIDQFFLYLFLLSLTHFGYLEAEDIPIFEMLDKCGEFINSSENITGIEKHTVQILNSVCELLSPNNILKIGEYREQRSHQPFDPFLYNENDFSMEKVLNAFRLYIINPDNPPQYLDDASRVPSYWDVKRSYKTIYSLDSKHA